MAEKGEMVVHAAFWVLHSTRVIDGWKIEMFQELEAYKDQGRPSGVYMSIETPLQSSSAVRNPASGKTAMGLAVDTVRSVAGKPVPGKSRG